MMKFDVKFIYVNCKFNNIDFSFYYLFNNIEIYNCIYYLINLLINNLFFVIFSCKIEDTIDIFS